MEAIDQGKFIRERGPDGFQYVFEITKTVYAVHGKFCTGCDATKGRCGELTHIYAGTQVKK